MKTILQIKLIPTQEQHQTLTDTMKRFNDACTAIAEVAFQEQCASKFELQKIVYHDIKARFFLSAQMTILAIRKVVEVYKRDKSIKPSFRATGAIVYDQRVMSFKGIERVSLWTLSGRALIQIVMGDYQKARWHQKKGQADLVLKDGVFYLLVTVDTPADTPIDPKEFIGVDLGVVRIATDSTGESFTGDQVESVRQRYHRLRKELQAKGTKSAKRHLKKISGRESRFRRQENHRIAKQLVEKAKRDSRGIAIEDLTHIRKGIKARKSQRSKLHGWSFFQLRAFITYKAIIAGIPVVLVDPRNTSRQCFVCGHTEKANRKSQSDFVCCSCGHIANADHNAALNIALRADVNQPIVCGVDGKAALPPN